MRFQIGRDYSRADVRAQVGLSRDFIGGPWFTGVFEHDSEFYIFANVGTAGRTGHDYENDWEGGFLRWYHKRNSELSWPSVKRLLSPGTTIHLFSRNDDRDDFRYHGYAIPDKIVEGTSPVELLLAVSSDPPQLETIAEVEETTVSDVIRDALAEHVERRRSDPEFQTTLERNLQRHKELLSMLADG